MGDQALNSSAISSLAATLGSLVSGYDDGDYEGDYEGGYDDGDDGYDGGYDGGYDDDQYEGSGYEDDDYVEPTRPAPKVVNTVKATGVMAVPPPSLVLPSRATSLVPKPVPSEPSQPSQSVPSGYPKPPGANRPPPSQGYPRPPGAGRPAPAPPGTIGVAATIGPSTGALIASEMMHSAAAPTKEDERKIRRDKRQAKHKGDKGSEKDRRRRHKHKKDKSDRDKPSATSLTITAPVPGAPGGDKAGPVLSPRIHSPNKKPASLVCIEAFRLYDDEQSGMLSIKDAGDVVRVAFNINPSQREILEAAESVCGGKVGAGLSATNVASTGERLRKSKSEYFDQDARDALLRAFQLFDTSHSGKVPLSVFVDMLTSSGPKEERMSPEDAQNAVKVASKDRHVDYHALLDKMFPR